MCHRDPRRDSSCRSSRIARPRPRRDVRRGAVLCQEGDGADRKHATITGVSQFCYARPHGIRASRLNTWVIVYVLLELRDTTVSGWTTIGENFMRLLVVTLCCFVAPPIVRADPTEDAAIKAIKQLRGRVEQNGKVVDLSSTQVTDAELKELAALKNLTTLDLSDTRVTGAGIKELAALKNLTTLHLSGRG